MSVFLLPKRRKKRLLNLINACPVKKTNWRRKQRGPPPQPCDSYLKCRESVYHWLNDEGFFWDPENLGSCLAEEAYGDDDCGMVDDEVNGRVDEKERKHNKQSHSARTRQMNIAAASVVDLWMSW